MRRAPEAARGLRLPPEIVREPGTTVHAQIEDWLAGQIAAGALVPGDRLPTEQDLAAWFGVSRMTLRHALAELARRGLVTRTAWRDLRRRAQAGAGSHHLGRVLRAAAPTRDGGRRRGAVRARAAGRPGRGGRAADRRGRPGVRDPADQ